MATDPTDSALKAIGLTAADLSPEALVKVKAAVAKTLGGGVDPGALAELVPRT
jgi:hypothetical protein